MPSRRERICTEALSKSYCSLLLLLLSPAAAEDDVDDGEGLWYGTVQSESDAAGGRPIDMLR